MKKLAFAFSAVILSCLVTCTTNTAKEGGTSEKAKKNLENTKSVIGMFEKGDFSKAGDYIAADVVDHSGPMGEVKGLDSLKVMFAKMATSMSNVKNEVVKGISDDEYSMVWVRQTWTQKTDDPMMGMKAGQNGDMQTVEVCKHGADGKITDHWGFMSMTDMMKMMPQMPKTQ
jgi:predicted SnoaL-like aldol condensation-catalyzing enzyme